MLWKKTTDPFLPAELLPPPPPQAEIPAIASTIEKNLAEKVMFLSPVLESGGLYSKRAETVSFSA